MAKSFSSKDTSTLIQDEETVVAPYKEAPTITPPSTKTRFDLNQLAAAGITVNLFKGHCLEFTVETLDTIDLQKPFRFMSIRLKEAFDFNDGDINDVYLDTIESIEAKQLIKALSHSRIKS